MKMDFEENNFVMEISDDEEEFEYVDPNEGEEDCAIACESEEEEEDLTTPFWFNSEERDQIAEIFKCYESKLLFDLIKTRSSRLFIGSIHRTNVSSGKAFQTFDLVTICNEQLVSSYPPVIPVEYNINLITTWDREEGLPESFFQIDSEECCEFWKRKAFFKSEEASFLYCEPHLYEGEFIYSSSKENRNLTYQFSYDNLTQFQSISWCLSAKN